MTLVKSVQFFLYPTKALNYLFKYKHSFVPDELRAPGVPPFRNCSFHTNRLFLLFLIQTFWNTEKVTTRRTIASNWIVLLIRDPGAQTDLSRTWQSVDPCFQCFYVQLIFQVQDFPIGHNQNMPKWDKSTLKDNFLSYSYVPYFIQEWLVKQIFIILLNPRDLKYDPWDHFSFLFFRFFKNGQPRWD